MSCGHTTGCSGNCNQGRACPFHSRIHLPAIWLLVAVFALLLAYVGPTIDDHSAEAAQADSLRDAQKSAQAQDRFAKAAARACGINAAWVETGGGAIQCMTHRGRKTITARVTP